MDTLLLLGLSLRTWKSFIGIIYYQPNTIELKSMNQTGTGGLQSFKVNAGQSLLILECIFEEEKTVSLEYLQLSYMQIYFWQLSNIVFTRAITLNVNKPT